MRATVFHGKGDVRVESVPDPTIRQPTDAIVRITDAGICGSDIWFYRGYEDWQPGWRIGHEFIGVVEDVGRDVATLRKGDTVIAPFAFSDGTCEFCTVGLQTSCAHGGFWGRDNDGGQAEAARVPFADATLVVLPTAVAETPALRRAALPLTDVMATGHHGALGARVVPGNTAVVVGDGAVGLCGVLAARRLGAERIVAVGHHEDRLAVARRFGATDVVDSHAPDAVAQILELTAGGAQSVVEAVGTQASVDLAFEVVRAGGAVGVVGAPLGVSCLSPWPLFVKNATLSGGVAPARRYIPELLADVVAGTLDPSAVLDLETDLAGVPDAYRAMDARQAIKVHIRV